MKKRNKKGVISETYSELQSIGLLEKAKGNFPVPIASESSFFKAIYQSVEIALMNQVDLLKRARFFLKKNNWSRLFLLLRWYRDFNRLILSLSYIIDEVILANQRLGSYLNFQESASLKLFREELIRFEKNLEQKIMDKDWQIRGILENPNLDYEKYEALHILRVTSLEIKSWEQKLSLPKKVICKYEYNQFIGTNFLEKAVFGLQLKEDTFFTQFRGLHQIPEILASEINNFIEKVIFDLQEEDIEEAVMKMGKINLLTEPMLGSLPPLVDNLSTNDYHEIRENLGMTSGSHSRNIHFHLFRDLYIQLAELFSSKALKFQEGRMSFEYKILSKEINKLSGTIFKWREFHIHLPRNNVGGGTAKSLIGAPSAVETAQRMKDHAKEKDVIQGKSSKGQKGLKNLTLTSYLNSEKSIDNLLLRITGDITKERFSDVQDRSGFFSKKSQFTPPSKRKI